MMFNLFVERYVAKDDAHYSVFIETLQNAYLSR
jgi:hypothetical protein